MRIERLSWRACVAPGPPRHAGFSYAECLVAIAILGVCAAPALESVGNGLRAAEVQRQYTVNQQRLKSRMEEVLANAFVTLDAAAMAAGNSPAAAVTAYSDAAGASDRLTVALYRYDGSAATGSDTGLLWVSVAIERSSLSLNTLRSR